MGSLISIMIGMKDPIQSHVQDRNHHFELGVSFEFYRACTIDVGLVGCGI